MTGASAAPTASKSQIVEVFIDDILLKMSAKPIVLVCLIPARPRQNYINNPHLWQL
jgi:hypothetical protein